MKFQFDGRARVNILPLREMCGELQIKWSSFEVENKSLKNYCYTLKKSSINQAGSFRKNQDNGWRSRDTRIFLIISIHSQFVIYIKCHLSNCIQGIMCCYCLHESLFL